MELLLYTSASDIIRSEGHSTGIRLGYVIKFRRSVRTWESVSQQRKKDDIRFLNIF